MRLISNALITLIVLLLGTGCIIVSDSGDGGGGGGGVPVGRADLTMLYTFGNRVLENGAACGDVGVSTVSVRVVGVGVADGASKDESCKEFFQGMTIKELLVGSYDVSISGKDASGRVLYETPNPARVLVRASGGGSLDVDLPALFGSITVWWMSFGEFEGNWKCQGAEVSKVRAVLYDPAGNVMSDDYFQCSDAGVSWNYLRPGDWQVVLNGLDEDDFVIYAGEVTVPVIAGQHHDHDVDLDKIVGDLTFYWRFDGSTGCGDIATIQVHLYNPIGNLYDDASYACGQGGISYRHLEAGEWVVVLEAVGSGGHILYRTPEGGVSLPIEPATHNEYYVDLY